LEAAGVTVTYSSDVIDAREFDRISPFFGMQIGISHQDPQAGENAPVIDTRHVPLSIEQLMLGYTINVAQQLQREDELGSIEVGKFADLIVLDHDIASIDPSALGDTEPVGIMIAGEWTEVPS
jgi:predicted amidohydrolase YtcJ